MSLPRSLGRPLGGLAAILLFSLPAQAGPLDELKALSQFPNADLARLKRGEIFTARGKEGDFSRGISLESCYFVRAPMAAVGKRLLHWNPTEHHARDVRLYREYGWPAGGDAFQTLRLTSTIAKDRWILEHTFAVADGEAPGDLHLTTAEVELIRKEVPRKNAASEQAREARANDVWGEILRRRSDALARGGIGAVPPYGTDAAISPGSEFRGLLSLHAGAAKHFRPILSAKPLAAGASATADETVGYWETTEVRGHNTLELGIFAARKSAESWQLVDCVYYPSDTYFMALDLFQLWPLEDGTLVWQVGFVSAPFRSYLGGVDRFVAGKQMTQETLATIKTFQADFAK